MTNGEKFKEVFKISQVDEDKLYAFVWLPNYSEAEISIDWWNAEYKEPITKNDSGVDAISRAEVLKIFDEWFATCDIADKKDSPKLKIKALPSVTPQQKYEDIAKAFQFGLAFGFGKKYDEIDRVVDEIKKIITPQPRKGHWIPTYGNVKCSVCGSVKDSRNVGRATHYCDFCGAKME